MRAASPRRAIPNQAAPRATARSGAGFSSTAGARPIQPATTAQRLEARGVEPLAGPARRELALDAAGEREVHVVAAEQEVVTDRGALEAEPADIRGRGCGRGGRFPVGEAPDEREVGGPAADVAH